MSLRRRLVAAAAAVALALAIVASTAGGASAVNFKVDGSRYQQAQSRY